MGEWAACGWHVGQSVGAAMLTLCCRWARLQHPPNRAHLQRNVGPVEGTLQQQRVPQRQRACRAQWGELEAGHRGRDGQAAAAAGPQRQQSSSAVRCVA